MYNGWRQVFRRDAQELQLTDPKFKLQSLRLPTSDVAGYGPSPNVGTIAFDTHIELLWVGDCHVRSLFPMLISCLVVCLL